MDCLFLTFLPGQINCPLTKHDIFPRNSSHTRGSFAFAMAWVIAATRSDRSKLIKKLANIWLAYFSLRDPLLYLWKALQRFVCCSTVGENACARLNCRVKYKDPSILCGEQTTKIRWLLWMTIILFKGFVFPGNSEKQCCFTLHAKTWVKIINNTYLKAFRNLRSVTKPLLEEKIVKVGVYFYKMDTK